MVAKEFVGLSHVPTETAVRGHGEKRPGIHHG